MLAENVFKLAERRARSRMPSFKQVKILVNEDKSIYDATLKNISAYGATISVALTENLPEGFNLQFVHDNMTIPCKVRWRRSNAIGVIF